MEVIKIDEHNINLTLLPNTLSININFNHYHQELLSYFLTKINYYNKKYYKDEKDTKIIYEILLNHWFQNDNIEKIYLYAITCYNEDFIRKFDLILKNLYLYNSSKLEDQINIIKDVNKLFNDIKVDMNKEWKNEFVLLNFIRNTFLQITPFNDKYMIDNYPNIYFKL